MLPPQYKKSHSLLTTALFPPFLVKYGRTTLPGVSAMSLAAVDTRRDPGFV